MRNSRGQDIDKTNKHLIEKRANHAQRTGCLDKLVELDLRLRSWQAEVGALVRVSRDKLAEIRLLHDLGDGARFDNEFAHFAIMIGDVAFM